jgi:V/A-type H+-transporting ATPase subunit E
VVRNCLAGGGSSGLNSAKDIWWIMSMNAEPVLEKILSDARAEAEKIKNAAEVKRSEEQSQIDEQLLEYRKQTDTFAQKAGEEKKAHLLAAARMDIAKQLLAEKRKILNEVFDKAREQLKNLPDEQYCKLMTRLMLEAVETGDEEVIIDNEERRINQKFIENINQQLAPGRTRQGEAPCRSPKGNLKLSGDRANIGGGFILKRGKIKNDVSVKVLLARARRELEIALAKELFED